MSGIFGKFNFNEEDQIDLALLQKMGDVLKHRGPDGKGIHQNANIGIGSRWLGITDSEEEQPAYNEKVAHEIGKIFGEYLEKSLDYWRSVRNEVDYSPYLTLDSPLKELALDAISSATSCLSEVENYLKNRGVKL